MSKNKLKLFRGPVPRSDLRTVKPPPKRADDIYLTPEYQEWRTIVIEQSGGRCQDKEHEGHNPMGVRLYADHIIELKDGGAPFDPRNGLARCASCHTKKTLRERQRRMGEP